MKQTAAKLLLSARRIIVSPAWLRVCYLTVGRRILIETAMSGTVIEIVNATVTATASVNVNGNGNGIEIGTETGRGTTHLGLDVMIRRAIMTGKDETGRKNESGSIGVALREAPSKNCLMEMNVQPHLDAAERRMMTSIVTTLETPRYDSTTPITNHGPLTQIQRLRRERTPRERSPHREARPKTRTPPAVQPPTKDDTGVHSGSEEGEIEED